MISLWKCIVDITVKVQKTVGFIISNNFYYAEALYENGEKQEAKVYFMLTIKLPTRKELLLEDEYLKAEAKKYLARL